MQKFIVIGMVAALAHGAHADTYKLGHGNVVQGDHRCASPKALARLTDFIAKDPKITIGHGQMTVTAGDKVSSADNVIGFIGFWHSKEDSNGASITMELSLEPYGWCTKSQTCDAKPDVAIRIAQTYAGATCVEQWRGDGAKL